METLYILLVLLIITRALGELAVRFHQPALVGELIAGIVLGVMAGAFSERLPVLANLNDDPVFVAITDLGVFFLMLLAGIEMRPKEFVEAAGGALPVAVCAMLLPLSLGMGATWFWLPESEYRFAQALFIGTGMAITAVPVAVRVLRDLGQLDTRLGRLVISAAVFDDVLSLMLLAILTAVIQTGGLPGFGDITILLVQIALFFVLTTAVGVYLLPWLGRHLERFVLEEFEFSMLLMIGLGFALLAEAMGMHFILGAFAAGLFFTRRAIGSRVYEDLNQKVSAITTGFLAPIFFASIGLHLDLGAITAVPGYLTVLLVIAFAGKLLGAGLPAWWMGFSRREALAIGTAMSARGAVELIIAGIALRAGLFSRPQPLPPIVEYMFSTIVIVAIVTTLAAPLLLRPMIGNRRQSERIVAS